MRAMITAALGDYENASEEQVQVSSSSLLLSSLELSDTQVYEPSIRALLEIVAHLCDAVVLKLKVPVPRPLWSQLGTDNQVKNKVWPYFEPFSV